MRTAHERKKIELKSRHERGDFPSNKLAEFTASEELRVSDEYESTIHSDAILTVLELRLRIPEKDRSGIIHFQPSINPADPRGQMAPIDQLLPAKMAFWMSEELIREMDMLSKLLKD